MIFIICETLLKHSPETLKIKRGGKEEKINNVIEVHF